MCETLLKKYPKLIWEPGHLQWQSQYYKYKIVRMDYNIAVIVTIVNNGLQQNLQYIL